MSQPVTQFASKDRASFERTVEGVIRRLLGAGLSVKARLKTSLRVGSGAATLAAQDGVDGLVMADGAFAAYFARDRNDSTKYFGWYENTTIRLYNPAVGDLWLIDPTTGLLTQAALGAITAGTSVTLNPSGAPTSGTRQLLPTGQIMVYFSMTAGAALAAFSTLGTIATAAHRPSGNIAFTMRDGTVGGSVSCVITSTGTILNDTALTNAHIYYGVATY
jgi:hypothetical protein